MVPKFLLDGGERVVTFWFWAAEAMKRSVAESLEVAIGTEPVYLHALHGRQVEIIIVVPLQDDYRSTM